LCLRLHGGVMRPQCHDFSVRATGLLGVAMADPESLP
jgi:hypothetical protein